jgi:hypothetical protein
MAVMAAADATEYVRLKGAVPVNVTCTVTQSPPQISGCGNANCTVGRGRWRMEEVAVAVQPLEAVAVTVKMPPAVTVMLSVVCPVFQT